MPTLEVVDSQKRRVGSIEVGGGVFDARPLPYLVYAAVRMQRACLRQGNASTRGRGEVQGSGKKPWKQKHTGRARAGSKRSPIWRHGGIVFGPRPRDYGVQMPAKMYRAALRSALSSKVAAGEILVLAELSVSDAKTKSLVNLLRQLGVVGYALVVVDDPGDMLFRAARNIPQVQLIRPRDLNVYDVLRCAMLVVLHSQVTTIQELWA